VLRIVHVTRALLGEPWYPGVGALSPVAEPETE
jgi:hypothetical protein